MRKKKKKRSFGSLHNFRRVIICLESIPRKLTAKLLLDTMQNFKFRILEKALIFNRYLHLDLKIIVKREWTTKTYKNIRFQIPKASFTARISIVYGQYSRPNSEGVTRCVPTRADKLSSERTWPCVAFSYAASILNFVPVLLFLLDTAANSLCSSGWHSRYCYRYVRVS